MSRITKTIAQEVAKQLVLPKRTELEERKIQLRKEVTQIVIQRLPTQVFETFEKHPGYFSTTQRFQFIGEAINFSYLQADQDLPYDSIRIEVGPEIGRYLNEEKEYINKTGKDLEELELNIESTLMGLRTYNKTQQQFPEAFALLPKPGTSEALMINVDMIRNKLK